MPNFKRTFCILISISFSLILPAFYHLVFGFEIVSTKDPATGAIIEAVRGELLVKFKEGVSMTKIHAIAQSLSWKVLGKIHGLDVYKVGISHELDVFEAAADYASNPLIEWAEPNYILRALKTPDDPRFNEDEQWGLYEIHAPEAWDFETGSSNVTIAILDTGVDYEHPDLSGKVIKGKDFIENDGDPMDDNGHGTHCAGIAAATTNNGVGIAGVSWGARILAVKVLDQKGEGPLDLISSGVTYAAERGAQIINMSLGGYEHSETLKEAIDSATTGYGCTIVAATGNDNLSTICYPARYDETIAVGAVNESGSRCTPRDWGYDQGGKERGSNYGQELDLMAPGDKILSTVPGAGYDIMSGTSMACPHVAGAVALLLSCNPGLGYSDIKRLLSRSCNDIGESGWDEETGWGILDVGKTMAILMEGGLVEVSLSEGAERIFTPNGDGVNDYVQFIDIKDLYEVRIFDLTGRLIKELSDGSRIWNGEDGSGEVVESGVYIFQCEKKDGDVLSGVVVVAR